MDVEQLSQNRVINFQECSALSGVGIWEGLTTLIEIFERTDPAKSTGPTTLDSASAHKSSTPGATQEGPQTPQDGEKPIANADDG